jgi:hypothetical protein
MSVLRIKYNPEAAHILYPFDYRIQEENPYLAIGGCQCADVVTRVWIGIPSPSDMYALPLAKITTTSYELVADNISTAIFESWFRSRYNRAVASFFMNRSEVAATASIIVSFVPHSSTLEVILIVISSNNFTDGVEWRGFSGSYHRHG